VTAAWRRLLPVALLAVVAVVAIAVVIAPGMGRGVLRPSPSASDGPLDIGSMASYPPIPTAETSVTLSGAGDIASCDRTDDEATAALLEDLPGFVFTAGDNAYESGTADEFRDCYDPGWGAQRKRTFPTLGNHDVQTPGATGYYDYFGARAGDRRAGWYAVDVGTWRLIVLNSNCVDAGGCDADTDQGRWLAAELAGHPADCTIAIWHHPRFSTGTHGPTLGVGPFWDALYDAGADVVVNGHDHNYERFAPVDPSGVADPDRGIRQFVAGTGGAALRPFEEKDPTSEVRQAETYGVLRLGLHRASYDWEFIPVEGGTFTDKGSGTCH
jgi:Calcineurin-like phosphoesterase